jgi:hypothetical protein
MWWPGRFATCTGRSEGWLIETCVHGVCARAAGTLCSVWPPAGAVGGSLR